MSVAAPPRPPRPEDPEALIEEARRRQRRRRRRLALAILALAAAALGAYYGVGATRHSHPPAAAPRAGAAPTQTLHLHLAGFGTALPTVIDSGPCPQGRTRLPIYSDAGTRVGTARLCVLTISKLDRPHWGLRRIVQTVREVDQLPGGTIVSRQRQTFLLARDQRHSRATFRGRVSGGSGDYAHAHGTVAGGGPGVAGKADWQVAFQLTR